MTTELTVGLIGAGAVILAALISFIVAVTSAVIAKEQKVSEFRQAWINDFRNDIAKVYSINLQYIHIITLTRIATKQDDSIIEDLNKNNSDFDENMAKIILKLNHCKDRELINVLDDMYDDRIQAMNVTDFKALLSLNGELLRLSRDIIAHEWKVVKDGGRMLINFRNINELLMCAFVVAFFVALAFIKIPELAKLLS